MTEPATTLARPISLRAARAPTDAHIASRLHPLYASAIERGPRGLIVCRGLPFDLGDGPGQGDAVAEDAVGGGREWLAIDRSVSIDLRGAVASHVVLLAFCDAWRDASGRRPEGAPLGWVLPVGEPLASATVLAGAGGRIEVTLRRRFEVNEGICGWGAMAFMAVPHRTETVLDWRGPHPRLPAGRDAPPGHTGPLSVLPGGWGTSQTGVSDEIPSATDDLDLWLHAIDVRDGGKARAVEALELAPIAGEGSGRLVVLAGVTLFRGTASPLRWKPRRSLRVSGGRGRDLGVDLGLVARRRDMPASGPAPGPAELLASAQPLAPATALAPARPLGWGVTALGTSGAEELELTAAADAVLHVGDRTIALGDLDRTDGLAVVDGVRIAALPPADRRVRVDLVDAAGRPMPARVRFTDRHGRYLPPLGHRDEVNPGWYEDSGADLVLAGSAYAYVDGSFEIDLPAEGAVAEVVRGFDLPPMRREVKPGDSPGGHLRLAFGPAVASMEGRWVAGDTHVHFLSVSTALLQARAEGVNVVHLLATAWGDLKTNLTDFGPGLVDAGGEHAVWVGSENRQNVLGHVGLVGTSRPVLPYASGGPPEGPIGGAAALLLADWLRACRSDGGLAVGAHFPLPQAEVAADIALGLLDALEFDCFDDTLASPPIREWYRYLDAGFRLPIVGGTDKMTATVPLGQIRTWARLADDRALTLDSWAEAVRGGRTVVSSGPTLELLVEGHGPGHAIAADAGATLEVSLVARAAQPIITAVELVHDGRVVAARTTRAPVTELALRERVRPDRTGWLAGRSRSPYAIGSAFSSTMAAHTSPVYVDVRDRPRAPADLTAPLRLVEGTRAWLMTLAPLASEEDLARWLPLLEEAADRLRRRG